MMSKSRFICWRCLHQFHRSAFSVFRSLRSLGFERYLALTVPNGVGQVGFVFRSFFFLRISPALFMGGKTSKFCTWLLPASFCSIYFLKASTHSFGLMHPVRERFWDLANCCGRNWRLCFSRKDTMLSTYPCIKTTVSRSFYRSSAFLLCGSCFEGALSGFSVSLRVVDPIEQGCR